MSGLVVKNSNELWFNNNKLSTSTGTKGLYIDANRNLFFNSEKIASGNLSNPKGLHLVNGELAYDGNKIGTELSVLISSLFANNEQGFAFDFNDLSTMYQDAAGTVPITGVGQPVGKVLDKSGCGNHATQSTSAKRPILQQNATTGAYYLLFDGVDDFLMTAGFPPMGVGTTLFTGTLCTKALTTAVVSRGAAGYLYQSSSLMAVQNSSGISVSGSVVATTLYSTDASSVTIRTNKTINTQANANRGFNTTGGLFIGVFNATTLNTFQGNMYSLIGINRVATSTEISSIENAIAKNVGVTL